MATLTTVEQIAETVLYEGYLLWPYRRSAQKNQQRWTFGGVYPRRYSQARGEDDPWLMQTECLVRGAAPRVTVKVRYLHVVQRDVAQLLEDGRLSFVDELRVGGERFLAWDEAREQEVVAGPLALAALSTPHAVPIRVPAGRVEEPLPDEQGHTAGLLLRHWKGLEGYLQVQSQRLTSDLYRLQVRITNETAWYGQGRDEVLRQTMNSTHTILQVEDGAFVSLMDPPPELQAAAEACENIKTWPVLAGEEGTRDTMLSSPIILYDYPQVAPESPGNLFDSTEIDQLLILNLLTLSDEEKEEIRATDPRARELLQRSESLTGEDFMNLHGVIREFRTMRGGDLLGNGQRLPGGDPFMTLMDELEQPAPEQVEVGGATLRRGSRVRLHPKRGGDIMDLALDQKVAIVEGIEQDYEGRVLLAVVLEDDPGRELGLARQPGHRFFFAPEEVEPLE